MKISQVCSARTEFCVVLFVALARCLADPIELQPVVSNLSQPLYVTSARDGLARLFLVERKGTIKVLQLGSTTPTIFLNISNRVDSVSAGKGLFGLAFHPQYALNRRFFVCYIRKSDGATVIAQYRASKSNPNTASTSEKIILAFAKTLSGHFGGMIEFGPDGFLYIGTGDGGPNSGNDTLNSAQNIESFHGKFLRIDVDHSNGSVPYSCPSDNPFFGSTAGLDEIFAWGFRNPWRWSFDRGTGALIVGDVGQDELEEVDMVERGGNYGWRVYEADSCTGLDPGLCDPSNYVFPIAQYAHTNDLCAITGGYVYRGSRSTLADGAYIYGDLCTGEIFELNPAIAGSAQTTLADTSLSLVSFGEDEAGELYAVDYDGAINRITTSPPPNACVYSIAPTSKTFSKGAGTGSFTLSTASDCGWIVAGHDTWVTVTSAKSGAGATTVTYSLTRNTTGHSRTTTITVAGKAFTVKQNR